MMHKPNVRIITLGCPKNEVDSEEIAGVLKNAGYLVEGSRPTSDLTIINTCGFLQAAKEEGIRVIKRILQERERGITGKVIVAGCLAQRLGEQIKIDAPGADAYVGVGQMYRFAQIVSDTLRGASKPIDIRPLHYRWTNFATRARTGAPWSAYLKISEGCDHKCTFCTIPSFRGKHESKPIEMVLQEARELANSGAREINLIAQDVTQYGYDLYREFTLPRLLRELNKIEGIDWIRLLYFHPSRLTSEVIDTMATLQKVLHYIDLPLQHVHPAILRAMKRPWDGERYLRLFEKLRQTMPDCAIRSTFIVGFPGESEAEFEYLLQFLSEAKLDRVGAFLFSREPGTPSFEMKGQVSARVKRERYDRLMRHQQKISLEINRNWIGRSLKTLIESEPDGKEVCGIGRSHRDAPEIDGLVFVEGACKPGEIVEVLVTEASEYDVHGRINTRTI